MTGPIQRAYVDIIPQMSNFGNRLRTQVRESVSTSTRDLGHINSSVSESVSHTERETGGMFRRMREQVKSLAEFAIPAIGAVEIFKFVKESIAASREETKQLNQTRAVLKSTGGAAHVTADEVEKLAASQSRHTGILRTTILTNENLLLTFTGVRNEVGKGNDIFNQATKTVLDMSVALKEDGKAASIQLGKALQDPVRGITALRRVGVAFTDQQKEQIKTLVKHGHTLDAQKMILHELTREFGGSAVAQSNSSDRMKAAFENMRVELGNRLVPLLAKAENFVTEHVLPAVSGFFEELHKGSGPLHDLRTALGAMITVGLHLAHQVIDVLIITFHALTPLFHEAAHFVRDELLPAFKRVADILVGALGTGLKAVGGFIQHHTTLVKTLAVMIGTVVLVWKAWTTAIKIWQFVVKVATAVQTAFNVVMDANPILLVITAVAALTAGFIYAYKHSKTFRDIIASIGHFFVRMFDDVMGFLKKWGPLILDVLLPFIGIPLEIWRHWSKIKQFMIDVWNGAYAGTKAGIKLVYDIVSYVPRKIIEFFVGAGKWLYGIGKSIFEGLWTGIKWYWDNIIVLFYYKIPLMIVNFFVNAATWLFNAGKTVLRGLWDGVKWIWDTVIVGFFGSIDRKIGNFFVSAARWLYHEGWNILHGLWDGILAIWHSVSGWFAGIGQRIGNFFINAAHWLFNKGWDILHGMWDGIRAVWNSVTDWLGKLPGRIGGFFTKAITWLLDSGKKIFTGLWNGIKSGFNTIVDWFKHLPGKILHALGISSPPKWAISAGHWIIKGLHNGLVGSAHYIEKFMGSLAGKFKEGMKFILGPGASQGLGSIFGGIGSAIGGLFGGGGTVQGHGSMSSLGDWVLQAIKDTGVSVDWYGPLVRRALFESSGNPSAINLTDQNAREGHPSMGLMQTIASTFQHYMLPGHANIWNPVDNLIAAIRYIRSRYGSIFAIDPPISGYAKGSWSIPRDQLALVHHREMILPARIADAVRASVSTPNRAEAPATTTTTVTIDEQAIARAVAAAIGNMSIRFDADGLARLVTARQGSYAVKGIHR